MNLIYRRVWQTVAWLLLSLITYLSLMPVPPMPFTFDGVDKLEHSFAYLVLALCFCQAHTLRWMVFLVLWGVGIEYAQGWTGYRYFDVWDMVANSLGVLLGGYLVHKTRMGRLFETMERFFLRA